MPKKIYISSTYRDLAAYRQVLMDTVTFLQAYFTVSFPMEFMLPGSPAPILDQCLANVAGADIYVLIIGKYYGTLAPDSDISFTHHEFRKAISDPQKIVIPLIAADDAESLKNLTPDHPDLLQAFITEVRNNRLTFQDKFKNPADLSRQLLLTLYPLSDTKWEVTEQKADIRYKCNRETQRDDFIGGKKRERLNVITIPCTRHDEPECFNQRMARFEFGLKKEYLDEPLCSSDIIRNTTIYEKTRKRFITRMMKNFWDVNMDVPDTINDCLLYFQQQQLNNIYLEYNLSKIETANANVIGLLTQFLTELQAACVAYKTTIFFVIVLEFEDGETPDESVLSSLTSSQPYAVIALEPMELIDLATMKKWMMENLTQKNSNLIDQDLAPFFEDKQSYTMTDALGVMDSLIKLNSTR